MIRLQDKAKFALLAILLLQLSIHIRISTNYVWEDEDNFLTFGWFGSQGKIMHRDYYDIRPPIFPFFTSLLFILLGDSLLTLRLAMAVICMLSTVLTYLIASRLYSKTVGVLASALFVLLSPPYAPFMVLSDSSIMFLSLLAFFIFIERGNKPTTSFLLGLILGVLCGVRQTGVWIVLSFLILLIKQFHKEKSFFQRLAYFFLGLLLVAASLLLFYSYLGSQDTFLSNITARPATLLSPYLVFMVFEPSTFFLLLSFAIFLFISKENNMPMSSFGLISVAAFMNYFPNSVQSHLLPFIPFLSIALSYLIIEGKLESMRGFKKYLFLGVVAFSILIGISSSFVTTMMGTEGIGIYGSNHYYLAAEYVGHRTPPGGKVQFLPHAPLYYRERLEPASSYYFWFMSTDPEPSKIENRLIEDLEREKPAYVVNVFRPVYHLDQRFPRLWSYLYANYHVETNFSSGDETSFVLRRN